jgi:hypothetical protein
VRLRVTIRALVALVLIIAFALAALRGANVGWAAASILATLVALCTATLGGLVRRGPSRPEWIGFALFGWAYFLLHFGPWADWKKGYGPARFTTWAVVGLVLPRLDPELDGSEFVGGLEEFVILRSGRGSAFFCATFHSLASLLFGLIGAAVGFTVSARGERALAQEPVDSDTG